MIQAVYIISKVGVPIFFKERVPDRDDVTKVTLFSGIISAIRAALLEIDAGEANYLTTQTHEIYVESAGDFAVALVKDMKDKYVTETINSMISELITQITFQFHELPEVGILTEEEQKKLESIVVQLLEKWEEKMKDSDALRKIQDSFW